MSRRGLALAALLAGLAGCSRTPAPDGQSLLTLAVRADVTGFFPNPPIVSEAYTIDVNRSIFECLVQPDRQFRLQPALAASWETGRVRRPARARGAGSGHRPGRAGATRLGGSGPQAAGGRGARRRPETTPGRSLQPLPERSQDPGGGGAPVGWTI